MCRYLTVGAALLWATTATAAPLQSFYTPQALKQLQQREQHVTAISPPETALIDRLMQQSAQYKNRADTLHDKALRALQAQHPNAPAKTEQGILVFASLALPKNSFNALLAQSDRYHLPVMIRGVLPEGFKATIEAIQRRIQKTDNAVVMGGVSIDPSAFRQFSITHVPAFVVVKKGACQDRKHPCPSTDFDVLYGDVSLRNALDTLQANGQFGAQITARPLSGGKHG